MKPIVLLLGCIAFAACKSNQSEADNDRIKDYTIDLSGNAVPDTATTHSASATNTRWIIPEKKPDDNYIGIPELPVVFDVIPPTGSSLNDFFTALQKSPQQFTLSNDKAATINLKAGTRIQFDAGSFVDPETGNLVNGNIELNVQEFYDKSDFVINKLTTQTDDNILESGGMVNIEARADGKLLALAPGKQVNLYFNQPENAAGMQTFLGKYDQDSSIIWEPMSMEKNIIVEKQIAQNKNNDKLECNIGIGPEFPGGQYLMYRYLNCKIDYPRQAVEQQIEGRVYVEFTISDSGYVENPMVRKGIGGGCDEAVIAAVKGMPRWRPGRLNGRNYAMNVTIPVAFSLTDEIAVGKIETPIDNYDFANNLNCDDGSLENAIAQAQQSEYFLSGYKSTAKQDSLIRNNAAFTTQYLITSSSLGWINCDRYIASPGKRIICKVEAPGAARTKVTMIFNNYNAVIAGSRVGNVSVFTSVPEHEPVTIFSIKTENGQFYYSLDQLRADENLIKVTDMQAATIDEIVAALKQLNLSTALIN